jgi:chromate reductase, NAD(P)H dehydrogenase (quinone)
VRLHRGPAHLPSCHPDLEAHQPAALARLRLQAAAALLVASPKYAQGASEVKKNGADWMVASGVLVAVEVELSNVSPRASDAHETLQERLTVMSAQSGDETGLRLLIGSPASGLVLLPADPGA